MRRNTILIIGLAVLILLVGSVAYWPAINFSFFWEDPFDIGQVEGHTFPQLFLVSNSNSYYRPLALVILKLLKGGGPSYSPLPYHAFNVGSHLCAALLLFGAARYWFHSTGAAFSAAILFVLYPPGFEAPARASTMYSLYVCLTVGALWLYAVGRERGRRRLIAFALLLSSIALLLHENGIMLPPLVLTLELYLLWQRRVKHFHPAAFVFFVPAIVFIGLWLVIPKSGEPPQWGLHPFEALYLSQGLTFPTARLISQTGGWGLTPGWQAAVAILLSLIILLAGNGRAGLPRLTLALAWWAIASSLAWLARPIEYLGVSPRVMYFPSFAASLAWAVLVAGAGNVSNKVAVYRIIKVVIIILIALQSWMTLERSMTLYRAGSLLMDQIIATGRAQAGQKLLFVNVPDRFEYREPLYPLGYWGMLNAPVSQKLSDFIHFTTGIDVETKSLSALPLVAGMVEASPYRVNTRGVDAPASELLYETILWADAVYWTDYHADGSLTLRLVGNVQDIHTTIGNLGRIGDIAEVRDASVQVDGNTTLHLTLNWLSLNPARPTDTIFVHLVDESGALVGQVDGDSLGGLVPPSAWRTGNEIIDYRTITFEEPLPPGKYRVTAGIYDRVSGNRYLAYDAIGQQVPDGELEILQVMMP